MIQDLSNVINDKQVHFAGISYIIYSISGTVI